MIYIFKLEAKIKIWRPTFTLSSWPIDVTTYHLYVPQICNISGGSWWESQFLGRLIRSLGVPKERGVWNSQGGRKDKLFFLSLHSLRLSNNNVSCLRTVSGLTLLANSVILKCKLWKKVWWGLYNLQTFFGFIGEYITSLLTLARGSDACVRSFLYLLYTLIKLYYTKALSNQASSLVSDWILLLRGPRIPVSSCDSTTTF